MAVSGIVCNFVGNMMDKKGLRGWIRAMKARYSQQELRGMSECVMANLLGCSRLQETEVVLMYHALPDEVDTRGALAALVAQGKTVLLPRVVSDTEMTVHRYCSEADVSTGSYGILEPSGAEFANLSMIDVCVVPGMAFTRDGRRLGRGKGYYDRFLRKLAEARASANKPMSYKIGVCFPFQLVDDIPTDVTDVGMDEMVG